MEALTEQANGCQPAVCSEALSHVYEPEFLGFRITQSSDLQALGLITVINGIRNCAK